MERTGLITSLIERHSTHIDLSDLNKTIEIPREVKGLRILDLGAGTSSAPLSLVEKGAEVVAVDAKYHDDAWLEDSINRHQSGMTVFLNQLAGSGVSSELRRRIEENERKNIQGTKAFFKDFRGERKVRYISASGTNLPFKDNTFDFAYATRWLNYLTFEPESFIQVVKEALRTLKPERLLQISNWAPIDFEGDVGGLEGKFLAERALRAEGIKWIVRQFPQYSTAYLECTK